MAANTDLLKKYKSLFSTTLSTGIGTGTSDTLTPATVTGLPTTTAVTLTLDRVDSSGESLGSQVERITGVISGGNLTSYVRAKDNTTEQAHAGGAVIEMVWNAQDWNDMVDWGLVSHNQSGYLITDAIKASMITASNVTASKIAASGVIPGNLAASSVLSGTIAASAVVAGNLAASAVTSGTLAASAVVAGNLAASAVTAGTLAASAIVLTNLAASSVSVGNLNFTPSVTKKVGTFTRDQTAASGNVAYTGVGFTPSSIIFLMSVSSTTELSVGFDDGTLHYVILQFTTGGGASATDFSIYAGDGSTWNQSAAIASFDSDGFTLAWTKAGTPAAGTLRVFYLAIK